MKITDEENRTVFTPTEAEVKLIKMGFDRGYIRDCVNDRLSWDECIDTQGNMEVDANAFDDIKRISRNMLPTASGPGA